MAQEPVRAVACFYTAGEFRRRARSRRARTALAIAGTLARIKRSYVHCNVIIDDECLYEPDLISGYCVRNPRFYPARPDVSMAGTVPRIFIDPGEWTEIPITRWRAGLDFLGLPAPGRVHSCARDCSRALGLADEYKRPSDLLRALEQTDGWHLRR